MKKIFTGLLLITLLFTILGCGDSNQAENTKEKKEITIGVSPGPYNELFDKAIKPILEKKGYTVKSIDFSDLLQSEVALSEGSVDLNVAQHTAYADNYNKEKGGKLTPIVPIPTVPAAIFSNKHTSLDQVAPGQKVGIPMDPSNAARAFRLLAKAGWITLNNAANPTTLTKNDIKENIHNIEIMEMDSAQLPRSLDDLDFAVIPGSIVYSAKMDAAKGLLQENVSRELELVVVVDEKNKDSQWAKDIVAAYKSAEFKDYMKENNKNNYWFIPEELK